MKTIKIILGIISVLLLSFFAIGIIVNETVYTTEISVDVPLETVFTEFNKSENAVKWIPEIKKIEVVTQTPEKKGTISKIVLDANGQEITMTEKVLAYVPNKKVILFYDAENMLKKNEYLFSENKGKTTITLNASCQSESYIMACMFPFFKGTFKAQDQKYLNNFKEFVANK